MPSGPRVHGLLIRLRRRAKNPAPRPRDDLEIAAGGRDAAAVDFLRLPRRRIKVKARSLPVLRRRESPDPASLPSFLGFGPEVRRRTQVGVEDDAWLDLTDWWHRTDLGTFN